MVVVEEDVMVVVVVEVVVVCFVGRGWGGGGGGRCGCGDERQSIYFVRRVVRVQEPCLELWASDEVPWIPREARRVSAGAACESSRSISVCWPRMRVCTSRARANKGAGQFLDPGNGSQTQGARGDTLLYCVVPNV